jgi:hypothetical protein
LVASDKCAWCAIWRDICKCIAPLNEASEVLSGRGYATISRILPVILVTRQLLCNMVAEDERGTALFETEGRKFAKGLQQSVANKFKKDYDNPLICAATILDPRYRDFDPSWMKSDLKKLSLDVTPQGKVNYTVAKRTFNAWKTIHSAHGEAMLLNAVEFVPN